MHNACRKTGFLCSLLRFSLLLLIKYLVRQLLVRYGAAHIAVQLGQGEGTVFLTAVLLAQLLAVFGEGHNAESTAL